ncbi:MAG TPA: GNAT family N-acetyltransferase [Pirellulales bacterium]|nr:GNAT family N-acetyltransferase [Pirellulales bacterium]
MLETTVRRSPTALGNSAGEWDDLWLRSAAASPLARAALVAQWADRFSPGDLRTIEVRRDGALVAALPLVARRWAGPWKIGTLPFNAWAACGTLLLDASVEPSLIADRLVDALRELPWPLIRLVPVAIDAACWRSFQDACRRRGLAMMGEIVDVVGQVEIGDDWRAYRSRWSKNHRRQIDKAARRARLAGELELDVHRDFDPRDIERLLRLGFEIEDRSWKGKVGTSVLRTPGMFDFFLEQAVQLARWQQLQLTFLTHNERPIAFEYGYFAKGTYFSHKVGYDPAYSDYSPGQLLRALLLERFHKEGGASIFDFCGPLTTATAKWSTRSYAVGKWLIAPRRLLSRCALGAHRTLVGIVRLVRRQPRSVFELDLGCSRPPSIAAPPVEAEVPCDALHG